MNSTVKCDYVIVGGGSAGCVLAARLSEDPDTRVTLLEAGPLDRSYILSTPGASFRAWSDPKFNWGYVTEAEAELNDRPMVLIQGKVLGGGSSINGMVYTRGQPRDFDAWRDAGCPGWGFDDVLPFFRRSEHSERGGSQWRGDKGEMFVSRSFCPLPIAEIVLEAGIESGYSRVDDFCAGEADGLGYYDWTVHEGKRQSTSKAFLERAKTRRNLTICTGAHATRILVENHRAVGVEYLRNGKRESLRAGTEVLLCSGAINSAQLLMLSGIGAADDLLGVGIAAIVDLPMVGRNLQNHLSYRIAYACSAPITAYRYMSPGPGALEVMRYVAARRGFFAGGTSPLGGFYRSRADLDHPDMQVNFLPALVGGGATGWRASLPTAHGFSLGVNQGVPYSRGEVRLRSADPSEPPSIMHRYLSDARDLAILADGIERMREIVAGPTLRPLVTREISPESARTRPELHADIRRNAKNHYHVAGTCRIGQSASDSVVDCELRVHGIEGLRVADAGVMPSLVNGNTNAAAIMIAERAAVFIRGDGTISVPRGKTPSADLKELQQASRP